MKTTEQVEQALNTVLESGVDESRYPGMSYEQGLETALRWMLEEIPDEEFPFEAE